jgi:AraC-like DNA-binding protein
MPAGLDALAAGAADVLGAMGESFVLYTSPVAKTFTAIRRSGIGEIPEGGVITRLVLDAPRSAFASIPVSGLDVGQGDAQLRRRQGTGEGRVGVAEDHHGVRAQLLHRALQADPGGPCAVEALLRRHGDPDRLRAAFRERYGCTPKRFRIRIRLAAAADLIAGGATATEAAARLGWHDASAFGRQFRNVHGCPPGRWRRER